MNSQKKVTETEVRKAVQRALKQILKDMENGPTLVIRPDENKEDLADETIADISTWLFNRR